MGLASRLITTKIFRRARDMERDEHIDIGLQFVSADADNGPTLAVFSPVLSQNLPR